MIDRVSSQKAAIEQIELSDGEFSELFLATRLIGYGHLELHNAVPLDEHQHPKKIWPRITSNEAGLISELYIQKRDLLRKSMSVSNVINDLYIKRVFSSDELYSCINFYFEECLNKSNESLSYSYELLTTDSEEKDDKFVEWKNNLYNSFLNWKSVFFKEEYWCFDKIKYDWYHAVISRVIGKHIDENPYVADQAPSELSDKKLENTDKVGPVFEGALNREFAIEALKLAHENSGLSQRKFAQSLGISHSTYRQYTDGKGTIDRIAELLNTAGYPVTAQLHRREPDQ